ncbi:MAG: hypothetical protein ACOY33_08260 [Pseudomonadota bacterium]
MARMSLVLWLLLFVFAGYKLHLYWSDTLFSAAGPLAAGKYAVWAALIAFVAYSLYCSAKEDLFATIGRLAEWHWGRQIGIDLYLGLGLTLFFIYLHTGSLLTLAVWLVPVLVYGNIATLLYVALNYDSLVARFLAG